MGSKSAIGIGNGICFKQVRDKGGGSYIDPLVRDSIVGIWKSDQNTNESPTRNIIKNTIKDKGGDLELLNFGYKLNSGYGKYIEDFSLFTLSNRFEYSEISNTKVTITAVLDNSTGIYHSVTEENSALYWNTFKIKVSGSTDDVYISYVTNSKNIRLYNGINIVVVPNDLSWHAFVASATNVSCNITLEFVPEYEGALVTDGKDDLITSTKTVKEMLGGSNEVTVVSMMLNLENEKITYTNQIRPFQNGYIRNNVISNTGGKYGIYGYKITDITDIFKNRISINNILGDRKDYGMDAGGTVRIDGKFSVEGYCFNDGTIGEMSQVAWYWTFISNKALTTDQINQVISYFNLDKHVKPDVYYDVKKQGLSNDTPEADWYLKDFSGNGHDMQLYNFAKKLGSGVGKYAEDFTTWIPQSYVADSTYTSNKLHITNIKGGNAILYTKKGTNAMKVKITGIQSFNLVYRYIAENDVWEALEIDRDGIYELPASTTTTKTYYTGFTVPYYTGDCDITIEQIPDYEGALVSNGKDDYGKAEGLPILKDYTVAADYVRLAKNISSIGDSPILSKNMAAGNGAFIMNSIDNSGITACYSFGTGNSITLEDIQRKIYYQSKYSNQGKGINAGSIEDGTSMWLDTIRDNDTRFIESAFYSMLLFPYTLSEFLLERQLKRYKLGTLYPDMVEFRPVIEGNASYDNIVFYYKNEKVENGTYFTAGSSIDMHIRLSSNPVNEIKAITVNGVPATFTYHNTNNNIYIYNFNLTSKSPQKINITIDEYIRYEDIVQPYPAIINLKQDGKTITWGDKLKVGSEVTFVNHISILPEIYGVSGRVLYNGADINGWNSPIIVAKSMVFTSSHSWKLNTTEPHAIYSPQKLNIPNSSLKILGYVPDLTGKGNHGRLNNFAYTEESGANEDGSIRFDGKDDHITIPTLAHGGKCMLMKVNWNKDALMLYDQRRNNNPNSFAIYIPNFNNEDSIAYSSRNDGKTYIDGVLNTSVKGSQLKDVTHNITITNSNFNNDNTVSPAIGSNAKYNAFYAQMVLYEFMLLPDVPDEEEIKELNNVMGIEGGYVESPNYYWDAYGKKNTDTDRNLIADQVSKDVANALEVKNVAYNSESGYTDDNGLLLDGIEDHAINTVIPAVTDFTVIGKRNILNYESVFAVKGGNTTSTAAFVLEYGSDKFYNFGGVNTVEYPNTITVATKSSYNNNPAVSSQGIDSLGLRIGEYRNYYSKLVFYKLMLYTKTIDQLSINMLKNLFERDELIDITNPIFKKKEL